MAAGNRSNPGWCISKYLCNLCAPPLPAGHANLLVINNVLTVDNKREKKLDERDGVCKKVNLAGTGLPQTDSGPRGKEKMAQCATVDAPGCQQQQKDVGISPPVQNDGLCCIVGSRSSGPENKDNAPGPEESPTKTVNPKPKESEKEASQLISPTLPSTSKCGGEVIRPRYGCVY